MKIVTKIAKVSLGLAIGAAVTAGSLTLAKPPGGGGGGGCNCIDLWKPVICSNGVIYSNSCYASCAHATGCVPYGDTKN